MLPIGLKGLQCIPMNCVSPECSNSDTGLPDDTFCVHILQVVTVNIWIIFGLIIPIVLLRRLHVGFQNVKLKEDLAHKYISFYRTRVRSLTTLVTNWLTHWKTRSRLVTWLMWPWRVKMPTQNLLRLLLLLMLVMRIVLATVCYRFGSWGLVIKLNFVQTLSTRFGQDFKLKFRRDFVSILLLILELGLVKVLSLSLI